MKHLTHIAERVLNRPLLIEANKLDVILSVLGPRIGIETTTPTVSAERIEKRDIYSVSQSGVAVIDIQGTLVNRLASGVDAVSGLTSYEEISAALSEAVADASVRGIMLRLQSGGGEASGVPDLAARVDAASKAKPVWAAVDDYAYSAAYWIASAANRIYTTITGGTGSIGVIARHIDQSAAMDKGGIKVTAVYAGAKKNQLSPFEPLSEDARTDLQDYVDSIYGTFVADIAKNRRMAKSAVRGTEAGIFHGQKAVDAGLADRIGTFADAMTEMTAMLDRGTRDDLPAVITSRKAEDRSLAAELRQFPTVELRASDGDEPLITGHIAVFGGYSLDIGGFREVIAPGAFAKTLAEADIHHYFNHDTSIVLGRNRSGTLRLKEDAIGLHIENDPPNTQTVRDLVLEPMRRGDIDQGSFGFIPVRQEWSRKDGELIRTLHEVRLFHTSIVPRGAYPQTAVAVRALQALASAPGTNASALSAAIAECESNAATAENVVAEIVKTISESMRSSTTPDAPVHLVPSAVPPSTETLHYRLKLARLAIAS